MYCDNPNDWQQWWCGNGTFCQTTDGGHVNGFLTWEQASIYRIANSTSVSSSSTMAGPTSSTSSASAAAGSQTGVSTLTTSPAKLADTISEAGAIGVGVGIGIPLLIFAIALGTLWRRERKRRMQAEREYSDYKALRHHDVAAYPDKGTPSQRVAGHAAEMSGERGIHELPNMY